MLAIAAAHRYDIFVSLTNSMAITTLSGSLFNKISSKLNAFKELNSFCDVITERMFIVGRSSWILRLGKKISIVRKVISYVEQWLKLA
jgi:hypothetical protein